ncbi:MAG: HAD family hydrolase [Armatimonadota bacterium]|nr:HAD family hydrolase [bacterium]
MMQVKAAIFDIGATLVTGPPVAPNKVIAKYMEGVTAAEIGSVIMTTDLRSPDRVCKALEDKFGCLSKEAAVEIHELWRSQATAAQALDGAAQTVLALKSIGLKIGLLSDIWNPYYASVERALPEVVDTADAIVLSCRSGSRKPSLDNFEFIVEQLGIEPSESVMIGDTYTHDIEPALKLGMRAVWVLARPDRESESIIRILNGECPAPTATVSNISETPTIQLFNYLTF